MSKGRRRGEKGEERSAFSSGRAAPGFTRTRTDGGYVSTGLQVLDEALQGGLRCGEMTMVASRAQAGSNSLLMGAALTALNQNHSVVYVSDRLKEDQIRGRMVLRESEVDGSRFCDGLETDADRRGLVDARERIAWDKLSIISRRTVTLEELQSVCGSGAPKLIVADFEPGRVHDGSQTAYRLFESALKKLGLVAKEAGAALLVRVVLSKGPCAPDRLELPGLGSVANIFDGVVLMHRDGASAMGSRGAPACSVEAQIVRAEGRDIRPRCIPLLFDQRFGGLRGSAEG